jgi:hypothetical protein
MGGEERCIKGFGAETLSKELEDLGVDGRIILKSIFKTCCGGMDWIDLAQDSERWRVLVTAVMNL